MTPAQLQQALNVRTLRAQKAERALRAARMAEQEAKAALQDIEDRLAQFDADLDARIRAFYDKAAGGVTPDALHSTRAFHGDLAAQRAVIEALIPEARSAVAAAHEQALKARARWAEAADAASKLQEICDLAVKRERRLRERRDERDADELSVSRLYQTGQ